MITKYYSKISSLIAKLNLFLKAKTIIYKIGVSKAATITLKRKPLINKLVNTFQGKMLKEHNRNNTTNVSINCEAKVEKLLRNQRCFPLVNFFQK